MGWIKDTIYRIRGWWIDHEIQIIVIILVILILTLTTWVTTLVSSPIGPDIPANLTPLGAEVYAYPIQIPGLLVLVGMIGITFIYLRFAK